MEKKIKKYLRPMYRFIMLILKISILKTLYVNFRKLPFKQAIKIPIFIYHGVKITSLRGEIRIESVVNSGMLKLGYNIDGVPSSVNKNIFHLNGSLIINGYSIISKGTVINIQGELLLGNCIIIGSGCFVKSMIRIEIHNNTRITYNCTIFDCDMHYVKNIETGVIKNNRAPIIIGKNCWINSGTIVSKGTVLPDYSITARNSFLNRDYSQYGTNLFLVGSPAKPIDTKVQRIFSTIEELRLNKKFAEMGVEKIECSAGLFDEKDENELIFKKI